MKKIGLTGGIGSGKSTVAARLREHGFPIVDADQIARDVVPAALPELVKTFGKEILTADGELNRAALAERAFVDKVQTQKLNEIMHPLIREETNRRFAAIDGPWAVYDMPLLVDLGLDKDMDFVVVVDVPVEQRVQRLVQSRGLSEADARRRIAQQISDKQRLRAADVVLDNSGTLEDLQGQIEALLSWLDGIQV